MATISLTTTPNYLSPVNKEIWYVVNSASSSLTDFKYIFTVNSKNEPFDTESFQKLQTYKLPPRPITGEAQYSPHRLLRATFDYDLRPTAVGWATISNNLTQFNLSYGFQYDPQVLYFSTSNQSGFMTLLTLGATSEFEIGDIITVAKDNKQINVQYDGTCSVTAKPLGAALQTDKPFGTTTSITESGKIINLTRMTGTTSTAECYNGTRQYLERTTDFTDLYQVSGSFTQSTNVNFMTNWAMPSKTIFTGEYETLSTILGLTYGYIFNVDTYDSSRNLLGQTAFGLTSSNEYKRLDIGIGYQNLVELTGSSAIFNNVDNYDVYISTSNYLRIQFTLVGSPTTYRPDVEAPAGTLNGRSYWIYTGAWGTLYIWWSSSNSRWEVTSALGGGNQWLVSTGDGLWGGPPEGTYTIEWLDGLDGPYFDGFRSFTTERRTEIKNFKIKSNCQPYSPVRLVFINKVGGVDYFTFTLDTKKSINIDKTKYTKILPYDYSVGMRGDTVLSQKVKSTYVITSNWLDDNESVWLEELISSPEVYWLNGTDLLPIYITDTQYEVQTQLRNQVFNLTLTFELAYNENIQNE